MNFHKFGRILNSLLLSALTAGTAGCQLTPAELAAMNGALSDGSTYSGDMDAPGPGCFAERFVQPESSSNHKVDLLFITDTSGSLDDERGAIADGIDAFILALPSNVDFRIATMLGHGSKSSWTGKLFNTAGYGPVLNSSTQTLAQMRTKLHYLLTHTTSDSYSDGGEEGLYSLTRALEPAKLATSRTQGFFRPDAALATVFISDENDICAQFPDGVVPVADGDHLEIPAKARDCAGITPSSVLSKVKELQGERPYLLGAIAYNNLATVPHGASAGEDEYGYGYLDLIRIAMGISVDIAPGPLGAAEHYKEGLGNIGNLMNNKLNVISDFSIQRAGVDGNTVRVKVDGQPALFTYTPATNEIHLRDAGVARSTVDITYCMPPAPSPTPSAEPTSTPSAAPSGSPTPAPSATPAPSPTPSPTPDCYGPGCGGGVFGV